MTSPTRKMKPSGIPWIGDVPADWESRRFRRAGRFVKGKLPSNDNSNAEGLPIIGASEMNGKPPRTFTTDSSCPQCEKDDVLILWDGANAGFVAQGFAGTLSSTVVKYRCEIPETCPRYVFYLLKYFETYFRNKVNGTTIPHMNPAFIDDCALLLPPTETQKKIAEFLDEKCAEIDTLIAVEEKMIAELKSYKQSVITEAVTRGVPAAANAARPLKDSGIPWLGSVPAHWGICMIKRIFHVFSGTTPKSEISNYWDGPFSWITPADYKTEDKYVFSGRKSLTREGLLSCGLTILPKGSIIFSKRAPIGAVAITKNELCTNQGCLSCVPKMALNEEYFYFAMSIFTEQFELLGAGTTFKEISLSDFADFLLPVPPKSEQSEISNYLNKKTEQINSVISIKQEKITTLQNYKKSIIFEYTTGKKGI